MRREGEGGKKEGGGKGGKECSSMIEYITAVSIPEI